MFDLFLQLLETLIDYWHYKVNSICTSLYYYLFVVDTTTIITLKIALCIMFLIVIRGCIPRYRYDFLTKIGWVKFLAYVLAFFLLSVFLYLLW